MIEISSDFDSGSLKSFEQQKDGSILLQGRDNHSEVAGDWKWIYFKATGIAGWTPRFILPNSFEPGESRLDRLRFWWSADGSSWKEFEKNHHSKSESRFIFENTKAIKESEIWVAFSPVYTFNRITSFVERLHKKGLIRPTPSCVQGLSLGNSSGGKDELGRDIPPHPLYAFELGADEATSTKTAVILGGVHPNEMPASFAIEGFIDAITSQAEIFAKNKVRLLVYPMVNPDGRYAGFNRSTVQHIDRDANRFWSPDLWQDMTEIRLVGEAILKDCDQNGDYFIDFHSWTNSAENLGILSLKAGHNEHPIWKSLLEIDQSLGTWNTDYNNWSSETFAYKYLDPEFNVTYETMYLPGAGVDEYKQTGRNMAEALLKSCDSA